MARRKSRRPPLGTIWEVPDALWERIEPILKAFWPRKPTGRPPAHWRRTLNGIIFRMRTGCQWEQLPRKFGPRSTVHDWFQRWCAGGVMERIIPDTVEGLRPFRINHIITGHCTGWRALHALADAFGDAVSQSAVGTKYTFDAGHHLSL